MWTTEQRTRLVMEKSILDRHFPALAWQHPADPQRTALEGEVHTNAGNIYRLRICVPAAFPATCPDMFVTYPVPLCDAAGLPMTGVSVAMHTLAAVEDRTKICHYRPDRWVPANTLYLVAMKGRIWLEAYEAHLRTGKPLDAFLRHMTDAPGQSAGPAPAEDSEEGTFLRLLRRLLS